MKVIDEAIKNSKNEDNPVLLNEDTLINSQWGFVHVGRGCVFKCTFCSSNNLEHSSNHLICPNCGRICVIKDGIYDFKKPHQGKGSNNNE